jgi:hypothetical protein
MLLSNGSHLSADRIKNDLHNASYNIGELNYKIENLLKKVGTINGYTASTDFKTTAPSQKALTEFTIECMSASLNPNDDIYENESVITREEIPNGTKIKNTFDGHIWVFNHVKDDGLTTYKWEDFGSDSTCIANNTGAYGLVTGS